MVLRMIRVLCFLAFLGVHSMASAQSVDPVDAEVKGVFFHGSAATILYLCSEDTPWWVDLESQGGSELLEAYESLLPPLPAGSPHYQPLYVIMRGTLKADASNPDVQGLFVAEALVGYSAEHDIIASCRPSSL